MCKYKSKITDTNGIKHFLWYSRSRQGVLENCSICMDSIICASSLFTVTKCKHFFHTNCLKNWTTNFNTNLSIVSCSNRSKTTYRHLIRTNTCIATWNSTWNWNNDDWNLCDLVGKNLDNGSFDKRIIYKLGSFYWNNRSPLLTKTKCHEMFEKPTFSKI